MPSPLATDLSYHITEQFTLYAYQADAEAKLAALIDERVTSLLLLNPDVADMMHDAPAQAGANADE